MNQTRTNSEGNKNSRESRLHYGGDGLVVQSCLTLYDPMDCSPPGSSVHGDSPGKNTGGGCHPLLQGIFPTQGSNPTLLHRQADSLSTELPKGSHPWGQKKKFGLLKHSIHGLE